MAHMLKILLSLFLLSVALYVLNIDIIYFESFGFEHIPKKILKILEIWT